MTGHVARPGEPVDRGRLMLELRSGKRWIIAAAVLGLPAAFALTTWVAPPLYTARTAVVFEQADPVESEAEGARQLRTMVDGITLPENLMTIRQRQGLDEDLADIAARLDIDYDRESNFVTIGATDRNPRHASSLANTAASVFVEHRRRFENDRRKELIRAVDDDLGRAQEELATARDAYDGFRRANGIADLSAETQRAIEAAAAMRAQADLAQGDVAAEQSRARSQQVRVRRVGGVPGALGAVESSADLRAIEGRLASARLELVEARSRFSEVHPDVQRLVSTIAALRSQRAAAMPVAAPPPAGATARPSQSRLVTVPASAATSSRSQAAQERQRTYARLAADAEQRLQQLSLKQGEAARLLAAQGVAEAHLAELEALRSRVSDEARAPVTGLRILSPAVPPEKPESKVKQPIFYLLIPLTFALLALVVLVLRQLRFRVHTAREVAFWGKGVTVASTSWPGGDGALEGLIAELADEAHDAQGSTLIVAAQPGDAFLARALAADLSAATARPPEDAQVHPGEVVLVPNPPPVRRATMRLGATSTPVPLAPPTPFRATVPFGTPIPEMEAAAAPAPVTHGALALRHAEPQAFEVRSSWRSKAPTFTSWSGQMSGTSLRRLARLADRVLVLVRSGATSIRELSRVRGNLGREDGVGFVILDLDERLEDLPDRAGSVDEYWRGSRG